VMFQFPDHVAVVCIAIAMEKSTTPPRCSSASRKVQPTISNKTAKLIDKISKQEPPGDKSGATSV
jgi:hypothetical protein